ncbi:putative Iron compound ABC transporter,periplasmic iron compound-binding protein [[Clostridium] ultunense Esp]|uniref:Putative Iron compound ABC transporter,periplasmic iron compound-binding protein n=1 Tax=[Clostridium] ultunense Esp TaxID=1288971 RepID=M1ZHL0_9FIRM|nr:ABC transporter substrate-binding protein [Schnuerera ultunensis]CCQ93357.1 putative Iron compound ABC transporter,periplasmic iron compound-binding protein [[Clostridium] ultunense Esp]SHD77605.1 putative Iron compound ABC transporter,periplasmic iron compound-binding protein [[Clostridium] ultunense Esp]
MNRKISILTKVMLMILVLSLTLTGCKGKEKGEETSAKPEKVEEIVKDDIDEDTGLVREGEMELKYAKSFVVDYLEGGYKVITDWEGRKTLLVPEGKEVPELKTEMNVIQLPIETVGIFSTTNIAILRPLGLMDKIILTTTERDRWHVPEIQQMMDEGKISYVGKNSAPDYEIIESKNPSLILITTGTSHGKDETIAKFDEMGIKWIGNAEQRETDPRGRLEWVKLAGALFDKEEEAEDFFEEQIKKIDEIEKKAAEIGDGKEKFASTFLSGDVYYVRNKGDYEVKMFELAGGEYIMSELNPDEDGNTKMNAEELYKGIENVDILFYNNINGPSIQSIGDLVAGAEYFADVKAVKEGRVWGYKPHYYQYSDHIADIIEDLYTIFTTHHGEITETEYFFLMK